jgi:hypothetical protein
MFSPEDPKFKYLRQTEPAYNEKEISGPCNSVVGRFYYIFLFNTVEPLITDTLINGHLQ